MLSCITTKFLHYNELKTKLLISHFLNHATKPTNSRYLLIFIYNLVQLKINHMAFISITRLHRNYTMTSPKHLILTALAAFTLQAALGVETQQQQTHIVVIPGQNGLGGHNIRTVLPEFLKERIHRAETPKTFPDLGQNRCISYLEKQMKPLLDDSTVKNVILHGSSQGTATALNYTANNHDKIGALILESVLLTGNSAIAHTVAPDSSSLFVHYALPYLAKIIFPFYAPAGKQAIITCDNLPKDLPIIILHATEDPQLSFKDAKALYAKLKTTNMNNNVYLLSVLAYNHVELLNKGDKLITIINAILEQHNLLPTPKNQTDAIDLTPYQPKPDQRWLDHFNALKNKEHIMYYIDWCVKGAFLGFIFYILHKTGTLNSISTTLSSHIHILHRTGPLNSISSTLSSHM